MLLDVPFYLYLGLMNDFLKNAGLLLLITLLGLIGLVIFRGTVKYWVRELFGMNPKPF